MTTATHPRFDDLDLDAMTTEDLIDVHAELMRARDEATSRPVVHQALVLRVYQVESAIAVRNCREVADLDKSVEQRTVARIAEWLRQPTAIAGGVSSSLLEVADRLDRGDWRPR